MADRPAPVSRVVDVVLMAQAAADVRARSLQIDDYAEPMALMYSHGEWGQQLADKTAKAALLPTPAQAAITAAATVSLGWAAEMQVAVDLVRAMAAQIAELSGTTVSAVLASPIGGLLTEGGDGQWPTASPAPSAERPRPRHARRRPRPH